MFPLIFIIIALLITATTGGLVTGIVTLSKPKPCVSNTGFYCSGADLVECPKGTYCNKSNMTNPDDCPSGYYCPNVTESVICPMGKYCPNICTE